MSRNDQFILEQWLVPKQDGMKCQSHTRLLVMFAVYNIVAIFISVLLAHPLIFKSTQAAIDWVFRTVKNAIRRILRRPTQPESREPGYNMFAFFLSIFGSMFLAIVGPISVGLSLRNRFGRAVNIWRLIQQWSTRPRATPIVAVAHVSLATRYKKLGLEGQNNYRLPILCAFLSELLLNCFSMPYLVKQHNLRAKKYYWDNGEAMKRGVDMALIVTCMQIGIAAFLIIPVIILIRFKIQGRNLWRYDPSGKERHWSEEQPQIKGRMSVDDVKWLNAWLFISLIIPSFLVFISNWVLWAGFLTVVPEDMYCLEGSLYIDLVYCLLPVALGIWRLICGTR